MVGEMISGLVSQDSVLCSEVAMVVAVLLGMGSKSSSSRMGDSWISMKEKREAIGHPDLVPASCTYLLTELHRGQKQQQGTTQNVFGEVSCPKPCFSFHVTNCQDNVCCVRTHKKQHTNIIIHSVTRKQKPKVTYTDRKELNSPWMASTGTKHNVPFPLEKAVPDHEQR